MPIEPAPEQADYDAELLALVRETSAAWVATWRETLAKDGRVMEGSWPGTTGEARAWVQSRLLPALTKRGLPFPTAEGVAQAARDLYAVARKVWHAEAIAERG